MNESRQAAEILARLNPKVVDHLQPPGAAGKINTQILTSCDVAAALTGVPRGPYLLARAKYSGDHTVVQELLEILVTRISRKAKKRGWSQKHPEWWRGMAFVALQEAEVVPMVCRRCKGRNDNMVRVMRPKQHWIPCPVCSGSGHFQHKEAAKARTAGIPRESWRRTWSARQKEIKAMLLMWEWVCVRSLLRQLRKGEDD